MDGGSLESRELISEGFLTEYRWVRLESIQ